MAFGSGSGVPSSCDVTERGPLVEAGPPLVTEPAVSIGREEEEFEVRVDVVAGAGLGSCGCC